MNNSNMAAQTPQYIISTALQCPYQTLFDNNGTSNPVYIGVAPSGASATDPLWQIKMLSYDSSGNLTSVDWASLGTNGLQWSQRASYTYS